MYNLALTACLLGTVTSIVSLTLFAKREHSYEKGKTLSELGARNEKTLREFRLILWSCGLLFAVAIYGLILPKLNFDPLLTVVATVVIACELLLGLFPARPGLTLKLHNWIAFIMGIGMLFLTAIFVSLLGGAVVAIEAAILCLMLVLGLLALIRKRHFLYFELPFIFLSHISILVAAVALFY